MRYLHWIDKLSEFMAKISLYLVLCLVATVCFDVLMRYLFGRPTTWAYDTALHIYSIVFLLGGAWALNIRAHIRIDVIYNMFSPRTRSVINILGYLFLLFPLCYFLISDGTIYAYTSWKMGEVSRSSPLHEPIWPLKTFIPLAFALLALQGIAEFIRDLIVIKTGKSEG